MADWDCTADGHCGCWHAYTLTACCDCGDISPAELDTREDDALEQARQLTEDPA